MPQNHAHDDFAESNVSSSVNTISSSPSNTYIDMVSQSFGSRNRGSNAASAGKLSRFAFNIYGNGAGNSPSSFAGANSPTRILSRKQRTSGTTFGGPQTAQKQLVFGAAGEVNCMCKSHESNDVLAIGGQKLLQVVRATDNNISIVHNINSISAKKNQQTKGKSGAGFISDVGFGYHNYSKVLAAGSISGAIYTFNIAKNSFSQINVLNDHSRSVNSLNFSSFTSHALLSGSQDGTVKIWDLRMKRTKATTTIQGNADAVRAAKFSNVTAGKICGIFDSGVIKKWDMRQPNQVERKVNAHTGPGLSIDWHPDIDYIVSGGRDKQIQFWNMTSTALDVRKPDHVISTSGAVGKVSWCNARQNSPANIYNTDIASCYYNDDNCIQIWNLKRRYVPKYLLEGHNNQITQILWKKPDTLWSCSKDKTLIQHDLTTSSLYSDNLPVATSAWNSSSDLSLSFVSQFQDNFVSRGRNSSQTGDHVTLQSDEIDYSDTFDSRPSSEAMQRSDSQKLTTESDRKEEVSHSTFPFSREYSTQDLRQIEHIEAQRPKMYSDLSTDGLSRTLEKASLQNQQLRVPSSHGLHELKSPIPSRLSTSRSQSVNIANFQEDDREGSPIIYNVEVPLEFNDDKVFNFLAANYLTSVPSDMDIFSVCEYNANVSASVNRFRDAQTWRTIKASVEWDQFRRSSEDADTMPGSKSSDDPEKSITQNNNGPSDDDSQSAIDTGLESLATSHSTRYAESPQGSLPLSHRNSFNDAWKPPARKSNTMTDRRPQDMTFEEAIVDGDDDDHSSSKHTTNSELDPESENVLSGPSSAKPIPGKNSKTYGSLPSTVGTYSYQGLLQPDFDDEKSPHLRSPGSFDMSYTPPNLMATTRRLTNDFKNQRSNDTRMKWRRSYSKVSSISNKSQLTKILNEGPKNLTMDKRKEEEEMKQKEEDEASLSQLKVPWAPEFIIREAAEYSASLGDLTMSGTIGLLFFKMYPRSLSTLQLKDWLYTYDQILRRRQLFTVASELLKTTSELFEIFKIKGQTNTSFRTYCHHCNSLILNEKSKEKMKSGNSNIEFGYWYCDNCNKSLDGCIFCNEPVKGMVVSLLSCGHRGHFGCMKTWFVTCKELQCPAGCEPED
ncbi:SEA (Seh1-associated) complex subunit [Komagataella phaffii CBS 7435]|uniref:Restriction of telomere capping protein 1 n=1 Tax=Komagataella phaffii (strain ATCC 76273 / CBS 7435 / CECT 11047 / NRRL Y-11430 / Wegner 21-1) TaxID=981350 RepID=A0A1G4KPG9_KOMPC|nr:GQ67_01715T0 [Komagataella phaffii]AOA66442.1 GQ68_01730T0 [Komagataella phaffii GS115]CAH2447116.1 SEA (Seh1-associated) complex subunit [Komagataella phaffii CBS 7435]SCV11915.1 SEA (Seh1-associated) complex subunit [Komagataella phaffii CBS 7435]